MTWDGVREDLLRKLWGEGLSASQVAERINAATGSHFTRNAIIGKRIRLNCPDRGKPTTRTLSGKQRRPKPKSQKPKGAFVLFNQMGLIDKNTPKRMRADGFVPKVFPPAPEHQRKTIATLEETSCRFPIGEPGKDDFHFCGAEKVPGKPYCRDCCAIAYEAPKLRKPIIQITPVPAFETEDA